MVNVEVHNKVEVRWVIVISLIYGIYVSDVRAHEPSHYVVCHLDVKYSISLFNSLTFNNTLGSGYSVVDIPCLNEPCIPEVTWSAMIFESTEHSRNLLLKRKPVIDDGLQHESDARTLLIRRSSWIPILVKCSL